MMDDFTRFCVMHACADHCKGTEFYCPLADEVKRRFGSTVGNGCKIVWDERFQKEEGEPDEIR